MTVGTSSVFGKLFDIQNKALSPYVAGAVAGTFVFIALQIRSARNRVRRPPGPKPFPLIGNLVSCPERRTHLCMANLTNLQAGCTT
jgi:hypothetical protein